MQRTIYITVIFLFLLLNTAVNILFAQSISQSKQVANQQQILLDQNRAQQALNAGNTELALAIYRQYANSGAIWAQVILGDINRNGLLIAKSLPNAVDWYLRAALNGSGDAQYRLTKIFCDENNPTLFRLQKCTDWLQQAINNGVTEAMYDGALIAYQGKYGYGNYGMAQQLATQAQNKGHPDADSLLIKIKTDIDKVNSATLIDESNIDERIKKGKYTIRLATFDNQFTARRFVAESELSDIYVYQIMNYTVCATDTFKTESSALKAIDKLPAKFKERNPQVVSWQQIKDNLQLSTQSKAIPAE